MHGVARTSASQEGKMEDGEGPGGADEGLAVDLEGTACGSGPELLAMPDFEFHELGAAVSGENLAGEMALEELLYWGSGKDAMELRSTRFLVGDYMRYGVSGELFVTEVYRRLCGQDSRLQIGVTQASTRSDRANK